MVLRQGGEPTPQLIYTFIETEKANHRVSAMCRALKVFRRAASMVGEIERLPLGLERTPCSQRR
jgi:hypothetical protein